MTGSGSELLSITKAAKVLGVHPLTLRNWAEKGHIRFYWTPGGHRRFRQKDLADFLAQMNQETPETALVTVTQHAVQQAIVSFPNHSSGPIQRPVWQKDLTEQQRETMRAVGRKLLGVTIQYAAGTADKVMLDRGRKIGRTYGKFAKHQGLSISEAVATFNFFRDTMIGVTFETPANVNLETTQPRLYQRLSHFFNEVLVAMVQAAEEDSAL